MPGQTPTLGAMESGLRKCRLVSAVEVRSALSLNILQDGL